MLGTPAGERIHGRTSEVPGDRNSGGMQGGGGKAERNEKKSWYVGCHDI